MSDKGNPKDSKSVTAGQLDVIELVLKEAKAYTSMDLIESYISEKKSLVDLPVQPLYVTIKNLPVEMKTHCLTLLSKEQREVFYDLDLWKKDELDTKEFEGWVTAVAQCSDDDIRFEFVQSVEFNMFVKGRFNIWTFDVEDPLYPDHDYYFLTEDNQLLIEYDDQCDIVDEAKRLIRDLYSVLGVDKAYQTLFTYISDSYMTASEEEYENKKNRLRDYGFVDYFDSLEIVNAFPSLGHIDLFINKKEVTTGGIDSVGKVQTLHQNSLVAFESNHDAISSELAKLKSDERFHYLHFNFVRLVNGNMEYAGVFKDGPVAMTRVGKRVRNLVILGLDYIKEQRSFDGQDCLFDYFDFTDLFKVGNSLVTNIQKRVKKELASYGMDEYDDKFLGLRFENFLDDLFNHEVLFRNKDNESSPVMAKYQWAQLNSQANLLVSLLPFIKQFFDVFTLLVNEGKLADTFYLNYDIESIDFEAIIISSFVNFSLGKFDKEDSQKMGVTVDEYREFSNKFVSGDSLDTKALLSVVSDFSTNFGLAEILGIEDYLLGILGDQIDGYDYKKLADEEFKHVGGPIIFNTLS